MKSGAPTFSRLGVAVIISLLLVASLVLCYESRRGQCWAGWTGCVMNNWREVGYWNLHGQVAANRGGLRAGEKPEIYPGYRGFGLLPLYGAYLLTHDFNAALLLLHVLLALVLVTTIWWFLGKTRWALLVASAFCLSPGFVRTTINWEPVAGTMLIGIPVMIGLIHVVADPPRSRTASFVILVLAAVYMQMEWSTFYALGVAWAACAVLLWPTRRRQFMLLTGFAFCLLLGSGVFLLWQKSGAGAGLAKTLAQYTIGPGGYDSLGMSWPVAVRRLATASAIGLLPLWVVFLAAVVPTLWRTPRQGAVACLPLLAAAAGICAMRNHSAHHQWTPIPVEAMGILVSLFLLSRLPGTDAGVATNLPCVLRLPSWGILLFMVGSALYCFPIVIITRSANAAFNSLTCLVTANTPRGALIVIGPELSDTGGQEWGWLMDRKWALMGAPLPPAGDEHSDAGVYVVNSAPLSGVGPLMAQSATPKGDFMTKLLTWYRRTITQRAYQLQQTDTYYLYTLTSH